MIPKIKSFFLSFKPQQILKRIFFKNILIIKLFAFLCGVLLFILFFYFDLNKYFDFEFFISKKQEFDTFYKNHPILFPLVYFIFYVFCATLSLPGAALLTLISGFLFNFLLGSLIVSLGSTVGATFAFLMSRFLLKNWIQKKFHSRLKTINKGLEKDGSFYLFSLRLIPIFPFFAVNLFMGVTPISTKHFFIASFLGMLPGTFVYVNAGSQFSHIQSPFEIFSPTIILSFLLLACLPWIIKYLLRIFPFKEKLENLFPKKDRFKMT